MSITQTQIDTLITELSDNKELLSLNYVVAGLNGIRNFDIEEDIIKLQIFLDELLNYDLVNYEDTYFYDIRREINKICKGVDVVNSLVTTISGAYHSRFLQNLANGGSGSGIEAGFVLPSRTKYNFVDVTLVGYGRLTIGDASITKECYFSSDSGTSSRPLLGLTTGDALYINADVIEVTLATTDQIEIILL